MSGTEDDKMLRERLVEEEPIEDVDFPVPIYMGPLNMRPKAGEVYMDSSPSAIDMQVVRDIAAALPCKHCGELPLQADQGDGRIEEGCIEGCPHNGAELYPHQWIEQNRKDIEGG